MQLCLGIDPNNPEVILGMLINGMIYHGQIDLLVLILFFSFIPAFQQTLRSNFTLKLFVLGRYIIMLLLPFPEYNYIS